VPRKYSPRRKFASEEERRHAIYLRKKAWREANPEKARASVDVFYAKNPHARKERHLQKKYNITLEQRNNLLTLQGNVCALCSCPHPNRDGDWAVDHDHRTGMVRGILCHHCNAGLGLLKDDPKLLREAARYVERHRPMALTRHGPKAFSWSYSKLKNYRACPRRHYEVDITKRFKEAESEQLKQGNLVHKMFEDRLAKRTPFPNGYAEIYEPWASRVESGPGTVLVEQQLAITADFAPCEWFAPTAWYRAKIDVLKIHGPCAIIIDWKTGKIDENSEQLILSALCIFHHYPEVQVVKSIFAWLAENAESEEIIRRDDVPKFWSNIMPEVEELHAAHAGTNYPAVPNRLCRAWCPVTVCPHNGRANGG
jgi:hypothetical protein